ncbi:hypothetical protein HBH69_062140 [Parastagonospora nodorum]|nr:hypothetical protein HBI06_038930 [Parastagonospora nodorum]KAH4239059.1 hypothetical protein HBI05_121910 [Parastagonospora nodorum]KAH5158534.1 hypothetical protein HBH69_062140 [Parastagonospora nodorum]KAH5514119.1 hypothetical protein HBI52_118340 [Parastagonospora nodorum]
MEPLPSLAQFIRDLRDIDPDCAICHDNLAREAAVETLCRHRYHRRCLMQWLVQSKERTCPYCNAAFHRETTEQEYTQVSSDIPAAPIGTEESSELGGLRSPDSSIVPPSLRETFMRGRTMRARLAQVYNLATSRAGNEAAAAFYKEEQRKIELMSDADQPEMFHQHEELIREINALGVNTCALDAQPEDLDGNGMFTPISMEEIVPFDLPDMYFETQFDAGMTMEERYMQWKGEKIGEFDYSRHGFGRLHDIHVRNIHATLEKHGWLEEGSEEYETRGMEAAREAEIEAEYKKWFTARKQKQDYKDAFPEEAYTTADTTSPQ